MFRLTSATLADGSLVDIEIEDGLIASIAEHSPGAGSDLDCSGLLVFPGFVDMHTHLREPGFESSETIASGSRAAARGGYTAVAAMANTIPTTDTVEIAEFVHAAGQAVGLVQVQPIGAVTRGLAGAELSDIAGMHGSNARVFGFSDDGHCVSDPAVMRAALRAVAEFDGFIAQHAQDPALTVGSQMNDSVLAVELGLTGWPAEAEERIIERDIELAHELNARLHICHLTTAGAVEIVRRAKANGRQVTAEVTPHHLLLTEDLVRSYNPVYKVNPPLRRAGDVEALRAGLLDGTIDVLATDHAPHSAEKKQCEWTEAAFGMIGLENAASVLQLALGQEPDWQLFEALMSTRAAKILGLAGQGEIAVGKPANICCYDPSAVRRVEADSVSLSSNDPMLNLELPGKVMHVFFNGRQTVRAGAVI